ncbi:MAG: T9SS type A sorting domain-containing protein [Ignavibacteria bacterium]|nr:T9SS type A sorting domain-containing protein [Ignavibacteria bacterium]
MPRATCIALSGTYLFVGTEEQGIWRRALADIVAVEAIPAHAATSLRIERNIPNPFSTGTNITFTVPGNQSVALRIHDMAGRIVAVPASGEYRAGTHTIAFDATGLPCGMYVCRLTSESESVSRTMIVAR